MVFGVGAPMFLVGTDRQLIGAMGGTGIAKRTDSHAPQLRIGESLGQSDVVNASHLIDKGCHHGQVGIGAHAVFVAAAGIVGLEIADGVATGVHSGIGVEIAGILHEVSQ